jgi:hypothetical protein
VAQGVISNLRGGSFKSGFIGGVIGKASGVATNGIGGASPMAITLRTVTAAVFGGLASEATGGSFADGALSAALTHLFNDEADNLYPPPNFFDPNYQVNTLPGYGAPEPITELGLSISGGLPFIGWSLRGGLFFKSASLCFTAGTLVHTKEGLKPIEVIKVGDLVAARDDTTGETNWKPVVQLFHNLDKAVLNLTLQSSGQPQTFETLGVTPEHPFHVKDKGWVEAGKLQVGDVIDSLKEQTVTVSAIASAPDRQDTYNFEVADYHTYFVGMNAAWVHNNCILDIKALFGVPEHLAISSKQIGKKWGAHMGEYPTINSIQDYANYAKEIYADPASVWTYGIGKYLGEIHVVRGSDLLRLHANDGSFKSLYNTSTLPRPSQRR